MREPQAFPVYAFHDRIQQHRRIHVVKGRIGVGEKHADISHAKATQQGIHKGMKEDISIGMGHH